MRTPFSSMAVAMQSHTDRDYARELSELRGGFLEMADRVGEMLAGAVASVLEGDADGARAVIAADAEVDRAEVDLDERCIRILARRQPMASDLRFITLVMKAVTDLERIGDQAASIGVRAISLAEQPPREPYTDIVRLAELTRSMVSSAVEAFTEGDDDAARDVLERDDEVDEVYIRVFHNMVRYMREHPDEIETAIRLQGVAKSLERIADHATNVAEHVVFMVRGKDIRHEPRGTHS